MNVSNAPVTNKVTSGRTLYLDYLRVLAAAAVIMLHISSLEWYTADVNGLWWHVLNFYNSISRWCTPVFLMISGALFLSRNEIPIKQIYTKYVLRLFTAYCAWSFIYYLFGSDSSVSRQFLKLFQPGRIPYWIEIINSHYHLWFVPMIAGIYICIPMLRQIVRDRKVMVYFLCLSYLFWSLIPDSVQMMKDFGIEILKPIITALYNALRQTELSFVMNYTFYFVLGYFLYQTQFPKKVRIAIYCLGLFGFVFTIAVTALATLKYQSPIPTYYYAYRANVCLEAVGVFELFKNLPLKENRTGKIMHTLSKWSFGAYLVHLLIFEKMTQHGICAFLFNPIFSVPILTAVVFLLSFAVSALLHCIPKVNKYIV